MIVPPPSAARAATAVAGVAVIVRCERIPEAGGELYGERVILLDLSVCRDLRRYLHGADDQDTAYALVALAHEAVHAGGLFEETATECEAIRFFPLVARMLGRPPSVRLLRFGKAAHAWLRGLPDYGLRACLPPTR